MVEERYLYVVTTRMHAQLLRKITQKCDENVTEEQ